MLILLAISTRKTWAKKIIKARNNMCTIIARRTKKQRDHLGPR